MIWFFFFLLMSLAKGLSIYHLKEPAFSFINLCFSFFHFFLIYFCLYLYYIFPSTNVGFFFCSSFSSCFRCKVMLSIHCFPHFLRQDYIAKNFPLRTVFAASHTFWVVVFSLSFVSRNFLISLLISLVTSGLFRNVLFNLYVFVFLTAFSL